MKLNKKLRKMCTNHLQHASLGVEPCLLKVLCLIKISSKSIQEKKFKFSLYLVHPASVAFFQAFALIMFL